MGKKILVTGNTGYIGPVMVKMLKERGHKVTGIDSDYYKGCELFEPEALPDKQITKDVRDISESDLDGYDSVILLSALSNDPLGELNPALTDDINADSLIRLARMAVKTGVERVIFSSSCSVYGIAPDDTPITEESPVNPLTAYARAKAKVEEQMAKMASGAFHPVFMRNATVYGLSPLLRLDLVVNNLLAWAHFTGKISIMSDGTPWRPIIHIKDFSQAFACAAEAPADKIHNQIINVGRSIENYRVKEIAEKVHQVVKTASIEVLNQTGSDERSYRVDFSKIGRILPDFKPEYTVEDGIVELFEAYRKYNMTEPDLKSNKYFRVRWIKNLLENNKLDSNLKWKR